MNQAGVGTFIREFGVVQGVRESLLQSAFTLRGQAEQIDLIVAETGGQLGNTQWRDEMLRGAAIRETLANVSPTRDLTAPALTGALLGKAAVAVSRMPYAQIAFREFTSNVTLGFGAGQTLTGGGPVGYTPMAPLAYGIGYALGVGQSELASGVRMLLGGL